MWSGTINFSLTAVPVKMYKATDRDPNGSLHRICKEHREPVKRPYLCSKDGKPLTNNDYLHAAQTPGGWVEISDADLESLPLKTLHTIDIETFVPRGQVPMRVYASEVYWLEPQDPKKLGSEPYALLRDALAARNVYGIGKVGMRDKEQLVAISAWEDAILLTTMTWPERLRDPKQLQLPDKSGDAAVKLASQIIDNLSSDWDGKLYHDEYAPALAKLIESKASKTPIVAPGKKQPTPVDLMSQLKASVAATKGKRKATRKSA